MEDIKLSIIIPVYNAEKTLDRCISSILDQEFDAYEVILVDDGSSDSSSAICDGYAGSDARFFGFSASAGYYRQTAKATD